MAKIAPTRELKEQVILQIKDDHVRGMSQVRIAQKYGISQPMVSNYIKEIRERWRQSELRTREELVAEIEERHRYILYEAWQAYERSKKNKKEIVIEQPLLDALKGISAKAGRSKNKLAAELKRLKKLGKKTTRTAGRIPAAEFLKIMMDVNKAIRELHGVDMPAKVDARHQLIAAPEWDKMTKEIEDTSSVVIPGVVVPCRGGEREDYNEEEE